MVSHCACPTRVFRDRALHEHRRPSSSPSPGPSDRARSASKKGTWPLPIPSAARVIHYFIFKGSLVDPRLRASNKINAPSKLARSLSGMGTD
jgi:hypothetical protein